MKKIIGLMSVLCISFIIASFLNVNTINEINLDKDTDSKVVLSIVSDYAQKLKLVKENNNSVYYDIKNSKLNEELKTNYIGDISVVTQQIGSKVRVYLKGENLENTEVAFVANSGFMPVNYSQMALFFGLISLFSILVTKLSSAKMELEEKRVTLITPVQSAANLNRQFYEFGTRKAPELVLSSAFTNPVKSEVYDFQYAKDRKNIKIAI